MRNALLPGADSAKLNTDVPTRSLDRVPAKAGTKKRGAGRACAWAAVTLAVSACSLSGPTTDPSDSVVHTPDYKEFRTLFVETLNDADTRVALKHPHETSSANAVSAPDPMSVIVNSVRLPAEEGAGDRDVLVILDIEVNPGNRVSLAVFYQRGASPGADLLFENLLVYSERSLSPGVQPWFRLRVLDVKDERNVETRALFNEISDAVGDLGTFVPHPIVPGAATAIRAAGAALASGSNKTIIDYTANFYQGPIRDGAPDLTCLRKGSWVFIGRPRLAGSEFWETPLRLNQSTHRVERGDRTPVAAPYGRFTIVRHDSIVPKEVFVRSEQLLAHLAKVRGTSNLAYVEAARKELVSGLETYMLYSRMYKSPSLDGLSDIVLALQSGRPLVSDDAHFLLTIAGRVAGRSFGSKNEAIEWWASSGKNGTVGADGKWKPSVQ